MEIKEYMVKSITCENNDDTVCVEAKLKKNFFKSLFCPAVQTEKFILAKDGALCQYAKMAEDTDSIWDVNINYFTTEIVQGEIVHTDKRIIEIKKEKEEECRKENAEQQKILQHNILHVGGNVDREFSEGLNCIASHVNWAYLNRQQDRKAIEDMVELYNATNGYEAKRLLSIDPGFSQCIGLGYTCFATTFNNGNKDVNDVAAESALFCLIMSYIEKNNTYVLPAIFTLFGQHFKLLKDTIEKILQRTFYYGPMNKNGYYKYNINGYEFYRQTIMYHCVSEFYDKDKSEIIISKDWPWFVPNVNILRSFLTEMEKSPLWGRYDLSNLGYQNMIDLFNSISDNIKSL